MPHDLDEPVAGIPIEVFWADKELDTGPTLKGELLRWGKRAILVRWAGELTIIPTRHILWMALKGDIPPGFPLDL